MIRIKLRIALGSCLSGLLLAPSALSEPKSSAHASVIHTAPRPSEPKTWASLRHATALPFGLRLPRFLSLNSWSAPSMNTRAASNASRTECRYQCTGTHVPTDRSRATTSAILAGVGAAAVVTGVVLTITMPRQKERPGLAPVFRVKLSGQRAVASADWRF